MGLELTKRLCTDELVGVIICEVLLCIASVKTSGGTEKSWVGVVFASQQRR